MTPPKPSPGDPDDLGRRFIAELRGNPSDPDQPATDLLRWNGELLDAEIVWQATLVAVELARDDGERWRIGDGLVDEQIATRPELQARWRLERRRNPAVEAVYRAVLDDLDASGIDRGWWGT